MGDIIFGVASIILGVVGSWGLYWLLDRGVRFLPVKIQEKFRAIPFLLPAAALLFLVSVLPLVQTLVWSFMDAGSRKFIGFENYIELFTSAEFLGILLNNFLWILFVPAITVGIGLMIATLTNQVGPSREKLFKSLIFMPMAISFISAATIWRFLYTYQPPGRPVIGLLNAVVEAFGGTSQPWLTIDAGRLNSFLLMIIIIWLQAGFSMVMLSAAIKGVPEETIEAARIDGANAATMFFKVVVPQIRGTIMSVFITVVILVMKIFDIVLAMTGGNFNTSVLGFAYYRELFVNSNFGSASAVVTILCVLIAPLMWLQIRSVRSVEENR
jgi:alpha-glucoside transport system permease protein